MESPRRTAELALASVRRDAKEVVDQAHQLKGMAANVSAFEMVKTLAAVERTAAAEDWNQVDQLLQTVEVQRSSFHSVADQWLESHSLAEFRSCS